MVVPVRKSLLVSIVGGPVVVFDDDPSRLCRVHEGDVGCMCLILPNLVDEIALPKNALRCLIWQRELCCAVVRKEAPTLETNAWLIVDGRKNGYCNCSSAKSWSSDS